MIGKSTQSGKNKDLPDSKLKETFSKIEDGIEQNETIKIETE